MVDATDLKSVDYRLHIRRGSHAKGGINNQFLITGFSRITKKLVKRTTICRRKMITLHRPGIEPGPPAWQASILPLNQRCRCSHQKMFDIGMASWANWPLQKSENWSCQSTCVDPVFYTWNTPQCVIHSQISEYCPKKSFAVGRIRNFAKLRWSLDGSSFCANNGLRKGEEYQVQRSRFCILAAPYRKFF